MDHNYDKYFLERYMNGECSEKEKDDFLNWLGKAEGAKEIFWMKKIWDYSDNKEEIVLGAEERLLQQVLDSIANNPAPSNNNKPSKQIVYSPNKSIWQLNPKLRHAFIKDKNIKQMFN
jgi:hypothetical protein